VLPLVAEEVERAHSSSLTLIHRTFSGSDLDHLAVGKADDHIYHGVIYNWIRRSYRNPGCIENATGARENLNPRQRPRFAGKKTSLEGLSTQSHCYMKEKAQWSLITILKSATC
jgi:hypothetical protein